MKKRLRGKAQRPQKKIDRSLRLPPILEVVYNLSKLVVVLTGVTVFGVSLLAKATWLDIVIRTASSLLLVGVMVCALNWLISRYMVEATLADLKEQAEALEAAALAKEKEEQERLEEQEAQESEESEESEESLIQMQA